VPRYASLSNQAASSFAMLNQDGQNKGMVTTDIALELKLKKITTFPTTLILADWRTNDLNRHSSRSCAAVT